MLPIKDHNLLKRHASSQFGSVYKPRKAATTPERAIRRKKEAARKRVAYALKTGRLFREACQIAFCGRGDTHAHHPDYDFPLDVLWLCEEHHTELHAWLNRAKPPFCQI